MGRTDNSTTGEGKNMTTVREIRKQHKRRTRVDSSDQKTKTQSWKVRVWRGWNLKEFAVLCESAFLNQPFVMLLEPA